MVHDLIKSKVKFPVKTLHDIVLLKSDGYPTYHLASVVDDHYMNISHVIRGEEWLNSVPLHLILYKYLNWKEPQFAHISLLCNPDGSKLSKRIGDLDVLKLKEEGFFPEAIVEFLLNSICVHSSSYCRMIPKILIFLI